MPRHQGSRAGFDSRHAARHRPLESSPAPLAAAADRPSPGQPAGGEGPFMELAVREASARLSERIDETKPLAPAAAAHGTDDVIS